MLCPDSELPFGERTKLVDFGIAKLTETAGGQGPGLVRTRTGATIGTPQYMSPEQCAGHKEIDAKTDVYSLGVMLFEMLAHKTPFAAESPAEIITMHLYEQPPSLSAMVPDVHPDLDRLVSSMLKKFATQRPTMEQVVEVLEALAAGTASSASPDAAPAPAHKEAPSVDPLGATQSASSSHEPLPLPDPPPAGMQRASAWVAAGALLLGLGIGGTGMVLWGSRSTKSAPSASACPAPLLAPSAAPLATWSVQTHPAGASVIRKSDGAVLGATPWKTDAPRTEGSSTVLLRRAGYADYEVTLAYGTSIYIDKQLTASAAEPSGVAAPVAAGGPPARVVPGSQKRGRKNGSSLATKSVPDSKDSVPVISEPEEFKHGAKPRAGGT